jgi:NADP-dependent 3-hydroxy acid dehydrogenase YdfG
VIGSDRKESAQGFPGRYYQCDVTDEDQQHKVVADILKEYSQIDAVVTCAGVGGGGPVHKTSLKNWQRVQDINVTGTFLTCKAVLPAMMQQRSGSIITISSVQVLQNKCQRV